VEVVKNAFFAFIKTFVNRESLPENDDIGWNMVKCGLLLSLDGFLQGADILGICNLDCEDVTFIIARNKTIN
jgi:hypothetical protein